jgi:hypothetical protein
LRNVGHHLLAVDIVEQIVIMAILEFELLVGRAGRIEELLAAVGASRLVGGAVEDD